MNWQFQNLREKSVASKKLGILLFRRQADKHRNKRKQHTMSQTSNDHSSIFTFTSTPSKTTTPPPPLFKPRKPSSSSYNINNNNNNSTNELLKRQIHQLKRRVKEQENELSSCYRQLNKMNCTIAGKQLERSFHHS